MLTESEFKEWLVARFPGLEAYQTDRFDDFVTGVAEFFHGLYEKAGQLEELTDIDGVQVPYLPFLARTLGIPDEIGSKIPFRYAGEKWGWDRYDDYDFYNRARLGQATENEVHVFRAFLKTVIRRYREKGVPKAIVELLDLFHLDATIHTQWTDQWAPPGHPVIDVFGLPHPRDLLIRVGYHHTAHNLSFEITSPERPPGDLVSLTYEFPYPYDVMPEDADIPPDLRKRLRVDSSDITSLITTRPGDLERQFDDGEIELVFAFDGATPERNVQIVFRGRHKFEEENSEINEYYIAGTGIFGAKLAIARVTYDVETEVPFYEVVASTGSSGDLLARSDILNKLTVTFEGTEVKATLIEEYMPTIGAFDVEDLETDSGTQLTVDLAEFAHEDVDRRLADGNAYLTNQTYGVYDGIGVYGLRIDNTMIHLVTLYSRPAEFWPTRYYSEDEAREFYKPWVTDYYAAEPSYYDSVTRQHQTPFESDDDFAWQHYRPEDGALVFADDQDIRDYTIEGMSVDFAGEMYSLAESREITTFQATLTFHMLDSDAELGFVFGVEDWFDPDAEEWVKRPEFFVLRTNYQGVYDLALTRVSGEQEVFVAGAQVDEDFDTTSPYRLRITRKTKGEIWKAELDSATYPAAEAEKIQNTGNWIEVSLARGPGAFKTKFVYDGNRKDAYFLLSDAEHPEAEEYVRRGVIRGIAPLIAQDVHGDWIDDSVIRESDPTGPFLGLFTTDSDVLFQNLTILSKDSETGYTYGDVASFVKQQQLLQQLTGRVQEHTDRDSLLALSDPATGDAASTYVDQMAYTTSQGKTLCVQVDDQVFIRRATDHDFLHLASGVTQFVTAEDFVLINRGARDLDLYDGDVDNQLTAYFQDAAGSVRRYGEYLDYHNLAIQNVFVDDRAGYVYIQLEYEDFNDGMVFGDRFIGSVTDANGKERIVEDVDQTVTPKLTHRAPIKPDSQNRIVFEEWFQTPYELKNVVFFRFLERYNYLIFGYRGEDEQVFIRTLRWEPEVLEGFGDREFRVQFHQLIAAEDQFIGIFQSYLDPTIFYVFYRDEETPQTHVIKYDANVHRAYRTVLGEDVVLYDIIQRYDGFLGYGKDADELDKLFLIEEKDIDPQRTFVESFEHEYQVNMQPYLLPEHPPYRYKSMVGGTAQRNVWFLSDAPELVTHPDFATRQALDVTGIQLETNYHQPDNINMAMVFEFQHTEFYDGDDETRYGFFTIADRVTDKHIHVDYQPSSNQFSVHLDLFEDILLEAPTPLETDPVTYGDYHVFGLAITVDDDVEEMEVAVYIDGEERASDTFQISTDFVSFGDDPRRELIRYFWRELYQDRRMDVLVNGHHYGTLFGCGMILSGKQLTPGFVELCTESFNPADFITGIATPSPISVDQDGRKIARLFSSVLEINFDADASAYQVPIIVHLEADDYETEQILDGKNVRFVKRRGDDDFLPYRVIAHNHETKAITFLVQLDALTHRDTAVFMYYGSDYDTLLSNPEKWGVVEDAGYDNYLRDSYDSLSSTVLNSVGRVWVHLAGISLQPSNYTPIPSDDQLERGYVLFDTKHKPVLLGIDEAGVEAWYDLTEFSFYGIRNIYSTHRFTVDFAEFDESLETFALIRPHLKDLIDFVKPAYTRLVGLAIEGEETEMSPTRLPVTILDILSHSKMEDQGVEYIRQSIPKDTLHFEDEFEFSKTNVYHRTPREQLRFHDDFSFFTYSLSPTMRENLAFHDTLIAGAEFQYTALDGEAWESFDNTPPEQIWVDSLNHFQATELDEATREIISEQDGNTYQIQNVDAPHLLISVQSDIPFHDITGIELQAMAVGFRQVFLGQWDVATQFYLYNHMTQRFELVQAWTETSGVQPIPTALSAEVTDHDRLHRYYGWDGSVHFLVRGPIRVLSIFRGRPQLIVDQAAIRVITERTY